MSKRGELQDVIDRCGFFPAVLTRAVEDALAGRELTNYLLQIDTDFDLDRVTRHVTLVLLVEPVVLIIHIDEDGHSAYCTSGQVRLRDITRSSMSYGIDNPSAPDGGSIQEVTLVLSWGSMWRAETESNACSDPACTNEHGFVTTGCAEDLVLRISARAEGEPALAQAIDFGRELILAVGAATPA